MVAAPKALACAVLGGMWATLAAAACSHAGWAIDYSPERCHAVDGASIFSCDARRGPLCGLRMSSHSKVGLGVHSMSIKAAPGAGVATTFYLSTNRGVFDKLRRNPWVEIDWEILGLQAGPRTRIWTNLFTGLAEEHNEMITVPFDVTADYHTYSFHVTETSVAWVVDGVTYRQVDIRPFPDVVDNARSGNFQEFVSVWGRSSHEPGEGIPAFRAALGLLDNNRNQFPISAGYRMDVRRRLAAPPSEELPRLLALAHAENRTLREQAAQQAEEIALLEGRVLWASGDLQEERFPIAAQNRSDDLWI
eukprot:CAMPEP_0204511776 /NCGR_PEP_ID=MMETSP0661-20131031/608_1 /ASSEMBLY_ACC=CAM_ASM_000606 /TAXON_ID=109239 /ORGANISM="Alexandrium margalefi, Strain AMGDE01CS-322" /LENGTH=305 /DNA_ID=CAMNT_0051516873 /DNA_START=158 /DNA_END=1075 /DNA_ORIENTATION=+